MIHIPPQTVPGGRYDIAQTCALLGIHRNSLRVYTAEEIQRFWHSKL